MSASGSGFERSNESRAFGSGNWRASRRIGKLRKAGKFPAPAFAHGLGQLRLVVGEKQERRGLARLLAHEDQRNLRAEQLQRGRRFERARVRECGQPLAERAIADLIVILQEHDERGRRQIRAGRAARLPPRCGDGSP